MTVQQELDEEIQKRINIQQELDAEKDAKMRLQQGYDIAIAGHSQLKTDFTALQHECQLQSRKDRQQSVIWVLWFQFQDTALNPSPSCPIGHLP